jgi:hypothetical protein
MSSDPRPGTNVERYDDRALRKMLRLASGSLEGLLMRQVPFVEGDVDREIFEDAARNGCLRFKDPTGAFADEQLTFDTRMGRLDAARPIDPNAPAGGAQLVRSGSETTLMRDNDPGTKYNRRVVEIVSQVLGLGIAESVTLGEPLPFSALVYLKPLPTDEDTGGRFVEQIVGALGRYKPQVIKDKRMFDATYEKLVKRMVASGVAPARMMPTDLHETILQESLRAMVKVEIWRKLWRWSISCHAQVADLRTVHAIIADPELTRHVRDLEEALKRVAKIVGNQSANGCALYGRAVGGSDFYVEAMPAIIYIRDARPIVDDLFARVTAWSSIWTEFPKTGSIKDGLDRFQPHLDSMRQVAAMAIPRAVAG